MLKDKKIILFFRGKDESGEIASQLMFDLKNNELLRENLNIEFINLEKRNLTKFLENMEVYPDLFFVFEEEKLLLNLIEDKFGKDIYIRTFAKFDFNGTKQIRISSSNDLILEDKFSKILLNELKEDFKKIKIWKINDSTFNIETKIVDLFYFNFKVFFPWKPFISDEDCVLCLKEYIMNQIEDGKNKKSFYEDRVNYATKKLEDLN